MHRHRRGFTHIELLAIVIVGAAVVALLTPIASKARLGDGLAISENNIRQILMAREMYGEDHAGQVPMRGSAYTTGQLNGWDGWNFGGRNCAGFWQTYQGGIFDESAYSRPLNQYLADARIPRPPGYVNNGSGPTWNFDPGTPTAAQRTGLKIDVFRSPRDMTSRERSWPNPTPGISAYDDYGTSYTLNMKWWEQPDLAGFTFTGRFNEGVRRIGLLAQAPPPSTFIWIHDQLGDVIPYTATTYKGEYGGANMSVVGFLDGHADYLHLISQASSGPGYTFEAH